VQDVVDGDPELGDGHGDEDIGPEAEGEDEVRPVVVRENEERGDRECPPGEELEKEPKNEQAPGREAERQRRVFPPGQAVEQPGVDGDGKTDQEGRAEVETPPPALADADLVALLDRFDDPESESDQEKIEEEEDRRPGLVRPEVNP
jgi:hypothetical protein